METYASDVVRHLANASYSAGILDEMLANGSCQSCFEAWTARRESIAVAEADGNPVDNIAFARATGEADGATNLDKDVRSALDALRARRAISTWTTAPKAEVLLELHTVAIKSRVRRLDGQAENKLQEDATELARALADAAEAADLREASRVLFTVIDNKKFAGGGQRMRSLLAPWLSARVLGQRRARVPVAMTLLKEMTRPDFSNNHMVTLARSMESAMKISIDGLRNIRLLRDTMVADCKMVSKKSSVGAGVEFFISFPMISSRDFEKGLNLSTRGANFVLDRMMASGVVESAYPERVSNRMFICRRALTL
jgi:hypothetical protein